MYVRMERMYISGKDCGSLLVEGMWLINSNGYICSSSSSSSSSSNSA